jgi:hypothetical protein
MKTRLKYLVATVVLIVAAYVAFMCGKYSHLITQPEFLLGRGDKAFVEKARQYALEQKLPAERLRSPKVVEAVRVYFGGWAGTGGVEVTITKDNAQVLEIKY